mmetsp:Transcript_20765/g.34319  ORF Transcript_20765/g.34319 Transcript_20765/m.34319 type:complete len:576 (-) Transcript_20765:1497-3224(-)
MSSCREGIGEVTEVGSYESALGFNYLLWLECDAGELKWAVFCLYLCLVGLYFYLLGTTADGYLSPTLGVICTRLRLSPELAGVTLLAFGNGSPDVVTSVACIANGTSALGLSALLGAGLFLLTVILGSVAVASPQVIEVQRAAVLRDIGFFALTIVWIIVAVNLKFDVTALGGVSFMALYAGYVVCVFFMESWRKKQIKSRRSNEEPLVGVSSAFWHAGDSGSERQPDTGYEFVTNMGEEQSLELSPLSSDAPSEENTASGVPSPPIVIDDYIPAPPVPVVYTSFDETSGEDGEDLARRRHDMTNFFWRSLQIKSAGHKVIYEWRSRSGFDLVWWVFELPFNLVRSLTIPCIIEDEWSKPITVLNPCMCCIFLLFVVGGFEEFNRVIIIILVSSSACCSILFQFLLHQSQPPRGVLSGVLLALAFTCCVGWIFLVANELVAVLSTLGYVVGMNYSILGLTVLAMGNSAGDWFANTAISRAGMANMAVAGCFGAPLLNILLGLGCSFFIVSFQKPPAEPLGFDRHSLISSVFILLTLGVLLVALQMNKYVVPGFLPKILFAIYLMYLALSVIAVFV